MKLSGHCLVSDDEIYFRLRVCDSDIDQNLGSILTTFSKQVAWHKLSSELVNGQNRVGSSCSSVVFFFPISVHKGVFNAVVLTCIGVEKAPNVVANLGVPPRESNTSPSTSEAEAITKSYKVHYFFNLVHD